MLAFCCLRWTLQPRTRRPNRRNSSISRPRSRHVESGRWTSGPGATSCPATGGVENAIYAAAGDGAVVRIAPESGQIVWRTDIVRDDRRRRRERRAHRRGRDAARRGHRRSVPTASNSGVRRSTSDVAVGAAGRRGLVIVRSTDHRVTAFEDRAPANGAGIVQRQRLR